MALFISTITLFLLLLIPESLIFLKQANKYKTAYCQRVIHDSSAISLIIQLLTKEINNFTKVFNFE